MVDVNEGILNGYAVKPFHCFRSQAFVGIFLCGLFTNILFAAERNSYLETFVYKENFEAGELHAWASYPPNQDTAYDPYLYPGKMRSADQGLCLVAKCDPLWNEDQVVGAVKRMDMILDGHSSLSFRYYLKTVKPASFLKIHFPLRMGRRLVYTIQAPAPNQWAGATIQWSDLEQQGLVPPQTDELRITALAITADIPRADKDMPIFLGIDDIEIHGQREKEFCLIKPAVVSLFEWKEKIPLRHLREGEKLALEGTYDFLPDSVQFAVDLFSDQDRPIFQASLHKNKRGTFESQAIVLGGEPFPPGLYRARIWAEIRGQKVGETIFTFLVESGKVSFGHPRLLFDSQTFERFKNRFSSARFAAVLDNFLKRARSSREKIVAEKLVFDIDQFPKDDWIASLPAWYTDRFMAFREALFNNAVAYASGREADAGLFCRKLLLVLARWPQWNHPWMEARAFHTYYPLGEFAEAYALAYDLTFELMTEEERKTVRNGLLKNYVVPAYKTYVEGDQITSQSSNWISHIAGGALFSLIALYGDEAAPDDLEPWLTGFILKLHKYLTTVFGKDGSYGEGFRYYNFAMQSLGKILPPLNRLLRVDLAQPIRQSYMETLWSSLIPKNIGFSFGDTESYLKKESQAWWIGTESGPMNNWAWLLNLTQDPYLAWLYRSLKEIDTLQEVLYDVDDIQPRKPDSLGLVKFFPDIGTAVFKSGWGENDFVFSWRCGPFINHQHMDQGTFYLADHGQVFLEERYDGEHHYYDDPIYRTHAIQPISHNTILIDRNPQSQKTGDPSGFAPGLNDQARFRRWLDSESFSFVSGSLEALYRDKVKQLNRSVLFIKPRSIILIDEVVPEGQDVDVNLLFHTQWKKDISLGTGKTTFRKGKSLLYVFHLTPESLSREVLEEPHFLHQLSQMPLMERGYLQVSARTEGKKLVLANYLTATVEGTRPPVEITRSGESAILLSAGENVVVALRNRDRILYKDWTTDALLLAFDGNSNLFAADMTFLNQENGFFIHSEKPIVLNVQRQDHRLIVRYHLEGESKLKVRMRTEPHSARLNGIPIRNWLFDSREFSISITLPYLEGELILE
jgi:hypothetical protein